LQQLQLSGGNHVAIKSTINVNNWSCYNDTHKI